MTFRSSLNERQVVSPDSIFTSINFIHATRLSYRMQIIKQNFKKRKK